MYCSQFVGETPESNEYILGPFFFILYLYWYRLIEKRKYGNLHLCEVTRLVFCYIEHLIKY